MQARAKYSAGFSPLASCLLPLAFCRRGVAATELAILLPFLALMFVGAVDFCRVYQCAQIVDESAHSGALFASGVARRDTDSQTATTAAKQAALAAGSSLSPSLNEQDVAVTIEGSSATVTVTYRVSLFTSYPLFPSTILVCRSVTMDVAPKAPGEP